MHTRALFSCLAALALALPGTADAATGNARFGYDSQLLGAHINGRWVTCEDLQENPDFHEYRIWGGHAVSLYGLGGYKGEGVMGAIHADHPGEFKNDVPGSYIYTAETPNGPIDETGPALLAVNFLDDDAWEPMPRKATALGIKNQTYLKAVEDWLASVGVDAKANIVQIFRVDIEGDGADEVFICAQNILPEETELVRWKPDASLSEGTGIRAVGEKNDYSVVLMRKVSGNSVVTVPVAYEYAEAGKEAETVLPILYKIYAFADLNGDGAMEVLIGEDYYEGAFINVYEIKKNKAECVLTGGFGV